MKFNRLFNTARSFVGIMMSVSVHLVLAIKYSKLYVKLRNYYWLLKLKLDAKNLYNKSCSSNVIVKSCVNLCLIVALSIGFAVFYDYSDKIANASGSDLPACSSDLGEGASPVPGTNCTYREGYPLCSDIADPDHRNNCFDLIDLPICNRIADPSLRDPGRNCVRKCSDSYFAGPDGDINTDDDTSQYGVNCVRLCNDMPAGVDAEPGVNCSNPLCHQLSYDIEPDPDGGNCTMVDCDKLFPMEHERLYLDPYEWKYCNKVDKCYNMPIDLLPYVNILATDKLLCNIHGCPPGPGFDTCGKLDEYNDVLIATHYDPSTGSSDYLVEYDKVITSLNSDDEPFTEVDGYYGTCQTVVGDYCPDSKVREIDLLCRPYNSLPAERNTRNPECDRSGPLSICQAGFCKKTVDCSDSSGDGYNEYCSGDVADEDPEAPQVPGDGDEDIRSWMFRPTPNSKSVYKYEKRVDTLRGEKIFVRGSKMVGWDTPVGHHGFEPIHSDMCYNKSWESLLNALGCRKDHSNWSRCRYRAIDLLLGTWHFFNRDLGQDSISPGMCNTSGSSGGGNKGWGYINLPGTAGLLYSEVDDDAIYHRGRAVTVYDNNRAAHDVTLCLRFKNTLCLQCAGKRECAPTAGYALWTRMWTQLCGRDVCRTLSIGVDPTDLSADPQECIMNENAARNGSLGGSGDQKCSSVLDTYLRMRAVYYDVEDEAGGRSGRVCGYLDVKGHLGYEPGVIGADNGKRHIGDGKTCQNDLANKYPDCDGFDSGSYRKGLAHMWRNVKKANYIGNNQPAISGIRGYYGWAKADDGNPIFYPEDYCAPVRMRSGSPMLYNLANVDNSAPMFDPPLVIVGVTRGQGIGTTPWSSNNKTDFHRPEIIVRYGVSPIVNFANGEDPEVSSCYSDDACKKRGSFDIVRGHNEVVLSLGFNEKTGSLASEDNPGGITHAPAYAKIESQIPVVNTRVQTELFVAKDINRSNNQPLFCVYEKTKNADGSYAPNPRKVGCVKRNRPYEGANITNSHIKREVTDHDNYGISIGLKNNVGGAVTEKMNVSLDKYSSKGSCRYNVENYEICASRGYCTQLIKDCRDALNSRIAAVHEGSLTAEYDKQISKCYDGSSSILSTCMEKRGLDANNDNIFDLLKYNEYGSYRCIGQKTLYLFGKQDGVALNEDSGETYTPPTDSDVRENYSSILPICDSDSGDVLMDNASRFRIGWHNEVVVSKGFDHLLGYVKAYKISADPESGICKINPNSRYLTDGDPRTNCLAGGDGYNCRCISAQSGDDVVDGEEIRRAKYREVGLHFPIQITAVCNTFIGKNMESSGVDFGRGVQNYIGENFPVTDAGVTSVGTCDEDGGWTYQRGSNNQIRYPKMQCSSPARPLSESSTVPNYEGEWNLNTLVDECIRKACEGVYTEDPNVQGEYAGSYDAQESGECKGSRSGFASWPKFTPSNAAPPGMGYSTANSCITGFKAFGSTQNVDVDGKTTSYSGGSLPIRYCGVDGQYDALSVSSAGDFDDGCETRELKDEEGAIIDDRSAYDRINGCERILCESPTLQDPTISSDPSSFALWQPWYDNGGATFPLVYASRNSAYISYASYANGTCNQSIGFFPVSDGLQPRRGCDHLGNWTEIENPCVTLGCGAITDDAIAIDENNGFAKWSEVSTQDIIDSGNGYTSETATSCAAGYIQNPYPPARDEIGNDLSPEEARNLNRPDDVSMPKRYCIGSTVEGSLYTIWRAASNPCINKCPGSKGIVDLRDEIARLESLATGAVTPEQQQELLNLPRLKFQLNMMDDRLGVGRTVHAIDSDGGVEGVYLRWPSTNLGEYAYVSNWNENDQQNFNASYYSDPDRNNDFYLMRRKCGNDGRWEDPVSMCPLNNGVFGNAQFTRAGAANDFTNSILSNTSSAAALAESDVADNIATGICAVPTDIDEGVRSGIVEAIRALPSSSIPKVYCKSSSRQIEVSGVVGSYDVINKAHIARTSNTKDCGTCGPISGQVAVEGDSVVSINPEQRRYFPTEVLGGARVNCGDGFALDLPLGNTEADVDVRLVCNASGDGNWAAIDTHYCKRYCTVTPSQLLKTKTIGDSDECGDGGVTYSIFSDDMQDSSELKIMNGEVFEFTAYRSCALSYSLPAPKDTNKVCSFWRRSIQCREGDLVDSSSSGAEVGTTYGGCDYSRYDHASNSWGSGLRRPISRNPYFVAYRHITRNANPPIASGRNVLNHERRLSGLFTVRCTDNCLSEVRNRGIEEGVDLTTRGPTWDDISVNNEGLYRFVPDTRPRDCREYRYFGARDLLGFDGVTGTHNPGVVIEGSCGPSADLIGEVPKIVCQNSGSWLMINENNCKNKYNSGAQGGLLFTTSPGLCSNGLSYNVRIPSNILIDHGQEGGTGFAYPCNDAENNVGMYKLYLRSDDGNLVVRADNYRGPDANKPYMLKYNSQLGIWSDRFPISFGARGIWFITIGATNEATPFPTSYLSRGALNRISFDVTEVVEPGADEPDPTRSSVWHGTYLPSSNPFTMQLRYTTRSNPLITP